MRFSRSVGSSTAWRAARLATSLHMTTAAHRVARWPVSPNPCMHSFTDIVRDTIKVVPDLTGLTTSFDIYLDTCNADLKQLHERYGYKVWLTEFSCGDGAQKRPTQDHLTFMREILPLLDAADFVYRCEYYDMQLYIVM